MKLIRARSSLTPMPVKQMKPLPLSFAARSSWLNVLITDEHTAGKMLDILDGESRQPSAISKNKKLIADS